MDSTAHELIARLRKHPDDVHAFAALKARYHDDGDFASLANLIEGWARRQADPLASAEAYHEAARTVSYYLEDQARAAELLCAALECNPRDGEIADDLDRVYDALGDVRGRLRAVERRAALLADAGAEAIEIAAVHFRLGELFETVASRPDRAVASYRTAFELDPDHVPAIYAAREIYRRSGNLRGTAELFDFEIRAESDPERKVALLRELAHLRSQGLSDLDGAVAALEQALSYSPSGLEILHELATLHHRRATSSADLDAASRELGRSADLMVRIAQMSTPLEAIPFCEAALDLAPAHDEALALYELLTHEHDFEDRLPPRWVGFLAHAPAGAASTRRRLSLGSAYEAFEQYDDAIACLEPLLSIGDAEAAARLAQLYRKAGRLDAAADADRLSLAALPDAARRERVRDLLHAAIESGDDDVIREQAYALLSSDPTDRTALDAVVAAERRRGNQLGLKALLLRVGDDEERAPSERLDALREAAVLAHEAHDATGLLDANAAIYRLEPEDATARTAVEQGLAAAGRDDDLARLLEWEARALPSFADRKRAVLALFALGRRTGAMPASTRELAIALAPEASEDVELLDVRIALERTAGDALSLLELLAQRVEVGTKKIERVALLLEIASLAEERLADDERAYTALTETLDLDPGNTEALASAERLCTKQGRTDRFIDLLEHRASIARGAERADLLMRIAEMVESTGSHEDAIARYEAALAERPDHQGTIEALRRLFESAHSPDRVVALLRDRVSRTNDVEAKVALLHEVASVSEAHEELRPAAATALREIRELREDDRALVGLIAYARARGESQELAELLRARIARVTTTAEIRDLRLELADLAFGPLIDAEAGIAELEAVRVLDPSCVPALDALLRAYEARGDDARVSDVLWTLLDGATDPETRRVLAARLHDLHTSSVLDDDKAIGALTAWSRAVPEDLVPVEALIPLLEAREHHAELVSALDRLGADETRNDRASLAMRAATVCASALRDPVGGLARFARAVQLGSAESEDQLRSLGIASHRERELAGHLEALGRASDAPSDAQRRLLEASELYEKSCKDVEAALEAAILAYDLGYGAANIRERIDMLARRAKSFARLLEFHLSLAEAALRSGTSARADAVGELLACAQITATDLGDIEHARSFVERAHDAAGADVELAGRVEAAARTLDGAGPAGSATFERAIVARIAARAMEATGEDRDTLLLRAARILAGSFGDARAAYELLHEASADEIRPLLFAELVALAVRCGSATVLEAELETRVDEALDGDVVRSLLRARAEVLDALGRTGDAADQLQRLSSMSPGDEQARVAHRDALRRAARHEDLARALEQAAGRAPNDDAKIALLADLAELWEGPLHNRYEAIDVWKRVAKIRPDAAAPSLARLSPRTRVGADDLEDTASVDALIPQVPTGSARRSVAPPPSLRSRSLLPAAPSPRARPAAPPAPLRRASPLRAPTPPRAPAPLHAPAPPRAPAPPPLAPRDRLPPPANLPTFQPKQSVERPVVRPLPAIEAEAAIDAPIADGPPDISPFDEPLPTPLTDPSIPELVDDLPEDEDSEALDPIRIAALQVRGIDPALLDEPIVDDFDADEAELVEDDDDDAIEDVDEDDHEDVLDDGFEDVSDETLIDADSEELHDVYDDEPLQSVAPLPTPPPMPPRKP